MMREIFEPTTVHVDGEQLVVGFREGFHLNDRRFAKFELLLALVTGASDMVTNGRNELVLDFPKSKLVSVNVLEESAGKRPFEGYSTVGGLTGYMRSVAQDLPVICPSKSLAMGVEIGFKEELCCVPHYLDEELVQIGVENAIISLRPAYGGRVLELYMPRVYTDAWGDVECDLRKIFNFDE